MPSIIMIIQRSICLQGKQQLFSQQLYKLLKGDDFQIHNCIIITGGSLEEIDPLVYCNESSKKLFYICSNSSCSCADDSDNNSSSSSSSSSSRNSNSSSDISCSSSSSKWEVKYIELFNMLKERYINIRNSIRDTVKLNFSSIKHNGDLDNDGISNNTRCNRDNLYDMQQESMFKNTTSTSTVSFYPKGMVAVKYLIEAFESDNNYVVDNDNIIDGSCCRRMNIIVIGKLLHEGDNINDGVELAVEMMNGLRLYDNKLLSLQLPPPPTIPSSSSSSSSSIEQSNSTIQSSHYSVKQMKHPLSWQSIYGKKLMNDDYTMFY
jgi:hypothetical protein